LNIFNVIELYSSKRQLKKIKTLLINHQDSFTRNVQAWLVLGGCNVDVCDDVGSVDLNKYDFLVLGPGPGHPKDWPETLALMEKWGKKPMLGICLGCQLITHYFGGSVQKSDNPCHGENVEMHHDKSFFDDYDSPLLVTRYNSLMIKKQLPDVLAGLGFSEKGDVLACKAIDRRWIGMLFHPDSFLSEVKFDSRWFFD
tara:strand:- start:4035 stop:4628 length:594 start_codon:yes stop_codon:yes gene_type:complete